MANYKTGVIVSGDSSGAVKSLKLTRAELDKLNVSKRAGTKATKSFSSSISSMSSLLKVAVPAVSIAVFASLASNTLNAADSIGKLSTRIGASTEALSEYRHVAELSGVQFNQLTIGWQRQTRRIAEAAQGTGEAKDALKELGLEATALAQLRPEDQFESIANAMRGVDVQADKVRLGMKLWDSEGVSMLQAIDGGAESLKRMREEAKALGKSMSGEQVEAAEAANAAMIRMNASVSGLTDQLVLGLAPGIARVIEKFNTLSRQSGFFAAMGGAINEAFSTMLHGVPPELSAAEKEILKLKETVRDMEDPIKAVGDQLDALKKAGLEGTPAWKAYSMQMDKLKSVVTDAEKKIEKLSKKTDESTTATLANTVAAKENKDAKKEQKDVIEELIFSIDKEAKASHDFQQTMDQLHATVMSGNLDFEYAIELVDKLATGQDNAAISTHRMGDRLNDVKVEVSAFAGAVSSAGQEIDSAFVDLWKAGRDGFDNFKDSLLDAFDSMIAEMAHQALTRPILVKMGLVGSGVGAAGAASASVSTGSIPYNSATGTYDYQGAYMQSLDLTSAVGGEASFLGANGGAIGAAGALGGLGAGAIWDGEYASTGGTIGGAAGMAFASSLYGSAAAAGPYGIAIAAIAALLGGYLGDRMSGSPNATYFNDADGITPTRNSQRLGDPSGGNRYRGWEDDVFSIGAFGTLGLSNYGSKDIDATQLQGSIDAITQIDDAISNAFGAEATARVRQALDGWSRQDNQADDFQESMLGRMNVILEALDFQFADIAQMAEYGTQSLENLTERLFLLKEIEDYIESSPLEGYAAALAESQKTLRDRLIESQSAVGRLGGEFDGTTESMQALAQGVRERYQLELQYLNQVYQVQESLNATIAGSIENIELSVMSTEQQYDYFSNQAEALAATIATLSDPAQIDDVVNRVNNLTNRAYGLLDTDQKSEVSGEFVDFLENVMDQANGRLDSARDEAVADSERFRDQIALAVAEGGAEFARHLEQTANIYRDATWDIHQAAYVWANGTTVDVNVHVDNSGYVGAGDFHNEVGYS